jgi:hypothetical protein
MPEETLRDRVGKLETDIPLIHKQMGVMDERTGTIATRSTELHRAFYGYDKTPGLLHDVTNLIEKMDDLKKLVWIVIAIVASIAVGGIYEMLVHAANIVK